MFFKGMALIFYIFFGLFVEDKTLCYIIVITLNAMDFWTVKNVSGRILVGLKWWSKINEQGKEEWMFASLSHSKSFFSFFILLSENENKFDNRVFWTTQYLMCAIWVIFAVVSLLSFSVSNFTVCFIGIILSGTNTMGYIKCDK